MREQSCDLNYLELIETFQILAADRCLERLLCLTQRKEVRILSLACPACCQTLQTKRVMYKCPASVLSMTSCCPLLLMAFASSRC